MGLHSEQVASMLKIVPAALHIPTHNSPLAGKDEPQFTDGETETQRCSVTCLRSTIRTQQSKAVNPGNLAPVSMFSTTALHSLP